MESKPPEEPHPDKPGDGQPPAETEIESDPEIAEPLPGAQRFTLQCVMAMFGEDVGLLPRHSFSEALDESLGDGNAYDLVFGLFREMNEPGVTPGGRFAGTPFFNGGLYRTCRVL